MQDLGEGQMIEFALLCVLAAGRGTDSKEFVDAYKKADLSVQTAFDMVQFSIENDPRFALQYPLKGGQTVAFSLS